LAWFFHIKVDLTRMFILNGPFSIAPLLFKKHFDGKSHSFIVWRPGRLEVIERS
jgi:hypothetical protein